MRFGGLVAVDDVSLRCRPAARSPRSSAPTAPARRRSSTASPASTSRPSRPAAPLRGRRRGATCCERMRRASRDRPAVRRRGAHLPEHPPVRRHDGAGEPDGRPAQQADARLGLHRRRPVRPAALPPRRGRGDREGARAGWSASSSLARADDPAGELPYGAQRRLEIARAMCTEPVLLCLDEPAAGLNPRESGRAQRAAALDPRRARHRRAADRARHERGDGDLRPGRRARLRPQDRRRRAGAGAQRSRRSSAPISATRTRTRLHARGRRRSGREGRI